MANDLKIVKFTLIQSFKLFLRFHLDQCNSHRQPDCPIIFSNKNMPLRFMQNMYSLNFRLYLEILKTKSVIFQQIPLKADVTNNKNIKYLFYLYHWFLRSFWSYKKFRIFLKKFCEPQPWCISLVEKIFFCYRESNVKYNLWQGIEFCKEEGHKAQIIPVGELRKLRNNLDRHGDTDLKVEFQNKNHPL